MSNFRDEIRKHNWQDVLSTDNLDVAYDTFESNILEALNTAAPFKKIQVRTNYKCWLTDTTKSKMKLRDLARTKAAQSQNYSDWMEYKRLRNDCTVKIRNDKKKYFNNMFENCENEKDVKKLYNITKKQLGWITGGPPDCFHLDGKLVTAPKEVAEVQMKMFIIKQNISLRNYQILQGTH